MSNLGWRQHWRKWWPHLLSSVYREVPRERGDSTKLSFAKSFGDSFWNSSYDNMNYFRNRFSSGGGGTLVIWPTCASGLERPWPHWWWWGFFSLVWCCLSSARYGFIHGLLCSSLLGIRLAMYSPNSLCRMHFSISYIKSLQTSVSYPWSLWKSYYRFLSLLWAGAYNGGGDRNRSLWRVRILDMLWVKGVRLLDGTQGSIIPLLIRSDGLNLSPTPFFSLFFSYALCRTVPSTLGKVQATFHMSCAYDGGKWHSLW